MSAWIFVALLQGAIGYIQYFNEVPALLVGIHVFGATVLWSITVALVLRTLPVRRGSEAAERVGAPTAGPVGELTISARRKVPGSASGVAKVPGPC